MFSYIITSSGVKKYLPTLLVFALTFFSGSRTALVVVLFQFIVFVAIVFTISKRLRNIINGFFIVAISFVLLLFIFNGKKITEAVETKIESLNFKENLKTNISNKSRLGIQYTSLLIFLEHPIIGVGFGQQAYHAKDKYPKWATSKKINNEVY